VESHRFSTAKCQTATLDVSEDLGQEFADGTGAVTEATNLNACGLKHG